DYFMQRYHDVISSFGGKTSYDADNRPLLVMRSNLWASGYDVDGTDQTSLGQFSGRVQQTYKHSVDRKSGSAGMPRPISYAVFCLKKKKAPAGARGFEVEWRTHVSGAPEAAGAAARATTVSAQATGP